MNKDHDAVWIFVGISFMAQRIWKVQCFRLKLPPKVRLQILSEESIDIEPMHPWWNGPLTHLHPPKFHSEWKPLKNAGTGRFRSYSGFGGTFQGRTVALPETNMVPENRPSQKENIIQPSIFRCELLVSGRVNLGGAFRSLNPRAVGHLQPFSMGNGQAMANWTLESGNSHDMISTKNGLK